MQFASYRTKLIEEFRKRLYFVLFLVIAAFFIIFIQLINLQIIKGKEYSEKARLNMENNIPLVASRGEIYDRNFVDNAEKITLASNRPSFNVIIIPSRYKNKKTFYSTVKNLSLLLDIEFNEIIEDIKKQNPWNRYIVKEDVPFKKIVIIAEHPDKFPEVIWEDAPVRVYPYKNMFSHVIGYIGSMSKQDYKKYRNRGYKYYQKIGKTGIEKQYDLILRGTDGYLRRIVDAKNRIEGEEIGQYPKSGYNMVLTLDYYIQKIAYEALAEKNGVILVIKLKTGEILSLVSKPDYDPNIMISKNNAKIIKKLYNDKNKPFLNRAIQSRYPPASTYKILVSLAALEEEKWNPNKVLFCSGKYILKGYIDRVFYCYQRHGPVDMIKAIEKSCSVYFYQVGLNIGPTTIMNYSKYIGFDKLTGIDIPGEIPGFVPSKSWKSKIFGQPWFDGDTLNLSIGQGFIALTPITMINLLSIISNSGIVYKPHILKEIRSSDNYKIIRRVEKEKIREIPLSPATLSIIKQGMRRAVKSGTAARLGYIKIPICGKTGTAQTRSKRLEKMTQHAWFIGIGPYDDPEKAIGVIVMVEYGIAGAATAVPIAEKIFNSLIKQGYM